MRRFFNACSGAAHVRGMLSEEMEDPWMATDEETPGEYLLAFDPLDGSSNIDVNLSVGSIFSVLRAPAGSKAISVEDFLQPGTRQVAAGYALYGPSTVIVLTVGRGTHGFTLDPELGEFLLTHPNMKVPDGNPGIRDQCLQQPFLGGADPPLRRGMHGGQERPARARTSTCAGSPRWWPRRTGS